MGNIPFTTLTMPSCLLGSSSEKDYSLPFLICYFKCTLANPCILFYSCYSWSVQNLPRIKYFVTHKLQVLTKRPFLSAGFSPTEELSSFWRRITQILQAWSRIQIIHTKEWVTNHSLIIINTNEGIQRKQVREGGPTLEVLHGRISTSCPGNAHTG